VVNLRKKKPYTYGSKFLQNKYNVDVETDLECIKTAIIAVTNQTQLDGLILTNDYGLILDNNLNFIYNE